MLHFNTMKILILSVTLVFFLHLVTSQTQNLGFDWVVIPGSFDPIFVPEGDAYFNSLKTKTNEQRPQTSKGNPGVRKELRCMSTSERQSFFDALKKMKNKKVGTYYQYDHLQVRHLPRLSIGAHQAPSFFGWHREFLMMAERGLQKYGPKIMLPYWDTRLDRHLDLIPKYSVFFSDTLMGNTNGFVNSGVFYDWMSYGDEVCRNIGIRLTRNVLESKDYYMNDEIVNYIKEVKNFKQLAYPFEHKVERAHGSIHLLFGSISHMGNVTCSPLDPVFFLHHSFIDNLYEFARKNMKKHNNLVYIASKQNFTNAKAIMSPFAVTNAFAAESDIYTRDFYKYEPTPGDVNCKRDEDCCPNRNTEFIWCNSKGRCASKAKEGAVVQSGYPVKACHCAKGKPAIVNLVCKCQ